MLTAVGQAWARSDLEVFEEHLFSEQLRSVLHEALAQLPPAGESPRVLLTTLPGEPHSLGLLLSQALLRLEGALCIFLGPQTPESQIVAAAEAYHADIVALSFSEYFPVAGMRDSIQRVRDGLPAHVLLWCGGRSARRLRKPPEGVRLLAALNEIGEGISAWRAGATGVSPADGAANDSDGRAAPSLSAVDQGSDQGGNGQDANNQDGNDQRS
jgi:methylmalonyl-CoA mutase cobalamin-binding subunit